MSASDTIYALSSGALPSGVAIVRLSGPLVGRVADDLCGGLPGEREARLRTIRDRNDDILDQALVLSFPAPASFTGEDCLELHLHGGRAVVQAVLSTLSAFPGLRHAEAGEFSRRAFQNGKLDLVEVEGLADLISAETEMQRRLAVEQAQGLLSGLYTGWAKRLTHARAMIEAELDFADEDDVPGSLSDAIWSDMRRLERDIAEHLAGAQLGALIRDGFRVVIAGPPNAGKSSLLNCLAKQDLAIVTDVAGTTRDVISVDMSLAGFAVKLYDTAGLRDTTDVIEQEGIRRARRAIQDAHLLIRLAEHPSGFPEEPDQAVPTIRVGTKIDRSANSWKNEADVLISVLTGEGIADLLDLITARLPALTNVSALGLPSRLRHADHLRQTRIWLTESITGRDIDMRAEALRQASLSVGRITGSVDVEDLLDVIFSEFCIGK